ncbi:hypothetical protein QR680_010420 [Steinernema hermaphroditum]|uniref:Protein kinase domain-containing protein n=1 Tax=Steinernema hermaphroditum TaxID=289476 RepID=A0AA39MBI4_9BILA|nr:hypothetical protein QR680_010420 [Steinernema hermaphroditum]
MDFRSRHGSESDLSYQPGRKRYAEKGEKSEKKRKKSGYHGRASLPCNKRKYSKGSKMAYEFGDEYFDDQEHVTLQQITNSPRLPTSPVANNMPKYSCLPLGREKRRMGHCFYTTFDEATLIREIPPETKQEDPEHRRRKDFFLEAKKALDDAKRQKNKRIEQLEVVGGESCEIRGETLKAYIKVTDFTTAKMGDVLWLQLQAYLAGRPMRKNTFAKSTNDHDAYILKERQRLGNVLEDIRHFRFDMPESFLAQFTDRNAYFKTLANDSYLRSVKDARKTVQTLLGRFDEYWSLFPRFKAIFPRQEGDGIRPDHREAVDRLELLYMWYNTFDSLRDVMKTVGDILQHRSATVSATNNSRSSRTSTDTFNLWPRDDYHSPTQSWSHVSYSDFGGSLSPNDALSKSPELDEQNMDTVNDNDFEQFLRDRFRQFYRDVVQQSLQLRGMREVLNQIDRVTRRPLDKAASALVSRPLYAHVASGSNLLSQSTHSDHEKKHDQMTIHHKHFAKMNLPPFYPFFQFLITIPVDLVEQWCAAKSMRTDSERGGKRDLLTINTLIEECHECLTAAIDVKLQYVGFVKATCTDPSVHLSYLRALDKELEKIFMKYFEYLFEWADSGSDFTSNDMEWNSATQTVDKLISEWESTKEWTVSIPSTESEAAHAFCHISKKVLNDLVLKFLQSEVERIDRMAIEAKVNKKMDEASDFEIIDESGSTPDRKLSTPHSLVFMQCRRIKRLIQNLRQRSLKALALLKAVSNDLEFCAKYKAKLDAEINGEYIVRKLIENDFTLLRFKIGYNLPFLAFCPKEIQSNSEVVNSLLNSICSRGCKLPQECSKSKREQYANESQSLENEGSLDPFNLDSVSQALFQVNAEASPKHYMVILSKQLFSDEDFDPQTDSLRCVNERYLSDIEIRKSTATSLSHTQVDLNEIYIVSETRCVLTSCRKNFEDIFSDKPDRMELSHDFCSLYDYLEDKLDDSRDKAMEICNEIWGYVDEIKTSVGHGVTGDRDNEIRTLRDTLLQSYKLAFEFTKEVGKLIPASGGAGFAERFVTYVEQWEGFLADMINKEQPISTTFWADEAFNCILMGYKKYAKFLSTEKIETLERSISHLIEIYKATSTSLANAWNGHSRHPSQSKITPEKLPNFQARSDESKPMKPADRFSLGCMRLDSVRDDRLFEAGKIGHTTEYKREPSKYFKTELKAPFRWQCFEKCLGRGQQGSVHVVFDQDNDRLLAMKRVQIEYNDEDQLKRLVLEVENLRDLDHINLVKYFGVEVKNECMMIFMEYCHEGTLERVCRERLDLNYVRRYTHQLLSAVEYIHSTGIVHRDIKPANIFLTRKDILKLGDFGCSFRLTSGSTIIGEIQEHIGTACYMAPEIATRGGEIHTSEPIDGGVSKVLYHGYGRAVDIWSTGCVVLEMLTGKRPYHHLKSDFQIYYALGTGKLPEIPPGLNDLTLGFLNGCLVTDPNKRSTAHDLLADAFANIQLTE